MENQPWYVAWGSILGFVSAVVLLMLHFTEIIQTIQRFGLYIWGWVVRVMQAIRRWQSESEYEGVENER